MKGFFTKQETASISRPDGKVYSCISCGGYKNCQSPKIGPTGAFKKKVMIIGANTSRMDDREGLPMQGIAGKKLKRILDKFDVDLQEDCLFFNTTRCLLTDEDQDERYPTNYEIECCRKLALATIKQYKPKVIILLGSSAVFSLIGNRWKKNLGTIEKWRGWTIPDQDLKTWLCPVYDPLIVDNAKGKEVQTIWEQDIERALSKLDEPIPIYVEPNIEYLSYDLLPVFDTIKRDNIAFDYETTGLKPHAEGHRIVCASVAISESNVYTFMMPKSKKDRKPFIDLLTNPGIGKIAQNMKFEDTWTNVRLGVDIKNWIWDTMLATHVLDNRPDITSLKFQVYVQFGVVDYDSEIAPYLKAMNNDNSNSINRIDELLAKPDGEHKLLKYCALDSIFEYRLAMLQRQFILPF